MLTRSLDSPGRAQSDSGQSPRRRRFALVRAVRPRQWLKNGLVVVAPLAAGTLFTQRVAGRTALAFVTFCLMSGAVYLVNDVVDAANDRLHPVKRLRPVAAGELTPRVAIAAAAVLCTVSLAGSVLASPHLTLVLLLYVGSSVAYNLGVKREPVFDLALVAAGFLLRAIAGGAATGVGLSEWFLLVASFGSLFMVAGKRYADVLHGQRQGPAPGQDPPVDEWQVVSYSPTYLRFVWSLAATATIIGYALWAFQVGALRHEPGWAQLSVAPFVLGILRYAVDIDRGAAGAPEDVVIGDRWLLVLGICWLILFMAAADAG